MLEMLTLNKNRIAIARFRKAAASKNIQTIILSGCGILFFGCQLWGQQQIKETIYLNGKAVAIDTQALSTPRVSITSPTMNSTYNTSSTPITLGGTASDPAGISQVTWTNSLGGNGACSGTSTWTCSSIPLQLGANVLSVSAVSALSVVGSDALTVSRCSNSISPATNSFLQQAAAAAA
jgi:hypothetical protein